MYQAIHKYETDKQTITIHPDSPSIIPSTFIHTF